MYNSGHLASIHNIDHIKKALDTPSQDKTNTHTLSITHRTPVAIGWSLTTLTSKLLTITLAMDWSGHSSDSFLFWSLIHTFSAAMVASQFQ